MDDSKTKRDAKIKKYCERIRTVEDLVQFLYKESMHAEEYPDYNARKAAEIRAKELLDIDLI